MKVEWDTANAALNLQKHGVSFEEAAHVFNDFGRIDAYDDREDYGEDRWVTLGMSWTTVLFVVYTIRDETTLRIISARKAHASEQTQYYRANGQV